MRDRVSVFPQSSLVASWPDMILLRVSETIGSFMKNELGNKVPASAIKGALQPVILEELVKVSGLPFGTETGEQYACYALSFLPDSKHYGTKHAKQSPPSPC